MATLSKWIKCNCNCNYNCKCTLDMFEETTGLCRKSNKNKNEKYMS